MTLQIKVKSHDEIDLPHRVFLPETILKEKKSKCFKVYFRELLKRENMLHGYALEINTDSGQYAILSSSPAATVKAVQEDHSLRGSMSQENPVPSLSWIDQGEKLCLDILELQIEKKYNIKDQVVWEVWFKIYDFGGLPWWRSG